jgi:hypothetical protein
MSAGEEAEKLLSRMTRGEKAQLLQSFASTALLAGENRMEMSREASSYWGKCSPEGD